MKNNAEIVLKSRYRHIYFCIVTIWRAACGAPEKAADALVLLFLVLHEHKWCFHAKSKPFSPACTGRKCPGQPPAVEHREPTGTPGGSAGFCTGASGGQFPPPVRAVAGQTFG